MITVLTLVLGSPGLMGQQLSGPTVATDTTAGPVEPDEAGNPSLLGPTTAVLPRAETSPDRSLAPGAGADTTEASNRLPFQLGLTLSGYYDDNIYVRPSSSGRVGDFIYDVVPFVGWSSAQETGIDNSIQINYSPGFVFYQDHPGNDTFEQNGSFVYGFQGSRCNLVISQQYSSVQNSAPDVGDLVKVQEYLTTINFDYTLSAKLSMTLRAQQEIIDYDHGFDSNQWTGSAYLNYELLPKTTIALGSVVGAVDLEGPNQEFVQVNGRLLYNPTEKLSVNGTAGVELRQTQGYSATILTPVFSGGFSYNPWDHTNATLNAYREYNYSAKYFGQDYLATGVSGSISQTFFEKLAATLSASFENAHYENNLNDESNDLGYNYFTVRAALDYRWKSWCQFSAFLQYRESISHTIDGFTDDQAGVQTRFSY